jgi:hypothetical protein
VWLAALPFAGGLAAALVACNSPRPTPGAGGTAASEPLVQDPPLAASPPDAAAADTAAAAPKALVLDVPRATVPIAPTGRFRIDLWAGAAQTHTLLDREGRGAVPVSEARLLWGDGSLYLFFYAGDLDLQAHATRRDGPVWNDDSVELAFAGADGKSRVIRVSVTGVVADGECPADAASLADPRCDLRWQSGVRAATDSDGTLNRIGDRDEEWAVEAAIPLASLGQGPLAAGAQVPVRLSRCEMAHDGPRACGAWAGTLVLAGQFASGDAGPPSPRGAHEVGALLHERD